MTGGASSNPCSDAFAGSAPLSEIEVRTASACIDFIGDKLYAYISFHSFMQLSLIPYEHTTERLDNHEKLLEIGLIAADALAQRYGTTYTVGNIAETIYIATETSVDWIKGTYQTRITYICQLRDLGQIRFLFQLLKLFQTATITWILWWPYSRPLKHVDTGFE